MRGFENWLEEVALLQFGVGFDEFARFVTDERFCVNLGVNFDGC